MKARNVTRRTGNRVDLRRRLRDHTLYQRDHVTDVER